MPSGDHVDHRKYCLDWMFFFPKMKMGDLFRSCVITADSMF